MLSGSARTKHPAEVAKFISFMTHDPEVARIMGYDRGVPATTAQFEAYEPSDAPSKASARTRPPSPTRVSWSRSPRTRPARTSARPRSCASTPTSLGHDLCDEGLWQAVLHRG